MGFCWKMSILCVSLCLYVGLCCFFGIICERFREMKFFRIFFSGFMQSQAVPGQFGVCRGHRPGSVCLPGRICRPAGRLSSRAVSVDQMRRTLHLFARCGRRSRLSVWSGLPVDHHVHRGCDLCRYKRVCWKSQSLWSRAMPEYDWILRLPVWCRIQLQQRHLRR